MGQKGAMTWIYNARFIRDYTLLFFSGLHPSSSPTVFIESDSAPQLRGDLATVFRIELGCVLFPGLNWKADADTYVAL